ncbi:MAG TPA: hypothetical protein VGM98_22525 [Schlesneria sp.]|jgi:hypothetical protein
MIDDILAFLRLFEGHAADPETHGWVMALVQDRSRWSEAHDIFDRVRERKLEAIAANDVVREGQYAFEEICLKSLYNETAALDPFDSDSPYWILKCAIGRARLINIPIDDIVAVVEGRMQRHVTEIQHQGAKCAIQAGQDHENPYLNSGQNWQYLAWLRGFISARIPDLTCTRCGESGQLTFRSVSAPSEYDGTRIDCSCNNPLRGQGATPNAPPRTN